MDKLDQEVQGMAPEQVSGLDLDVIRELGSQNLVLVVEDDPDTMGLLKLSLQRAGYNVVGALDGKEAIRKWTETNPSVVLLDLMMPEMDGWEAMRRLRAVSSVPIIILSALVSNDHVVRGLREGADDYVTKPFIPDEVIARIEAALRRVGTAEPSSHLIFPEINLSIDLETRHVTLGNEVVTLTPREFDVLEVLAKKADKPVPYSEIAQQVWGEENKKTLDRIKWTIYLLRKKLEKDPRNPRLIINQTRYGYQLVTR